MIRSEPVEQTIFWLFLVGLAWVPFWYGSNDWLAWGANAIIFPGLTAFYELSLLVRRKSHPIAITNLTLPAVLFAGVISWIVVQTITWPHLALANSIWDLATNALGRPVVESISVNRDLTALAFMRLTTAASVFWLALQLCRDAKRASQLMVGIGAIVAVYSTYGVIALKFKQLPWLQYSVSLDDGRLSSTFINPDTFATFAAIGIIVIGGLILEFYDAKMRVAAGNWKMQAALFLELTGGWGSLLLSAAFVTSVALLLTGSRGGVIAALVGLVIFGLLVRQFRVRTRTPFLLVIIVAALVVGTSITFGELLRDKFLQGGGIYDENRLSVYLLTLRSIFDRPITGYGYGTFADVFPMYRDATISAVGVWEQAHNTYLEIFQGLGVPFGLMLLICVLVIVMRCGQGALRRQRDAIVPCIAVGAACVVAVDAMVDFSLQIQAVTVAFMAILGAGTAQAESSRAGLCD